MAYHIDVLSKLGRKIRVSKRHWEHITKKHESIESLEDKVREALINPDIIRLSKEDPRVYLYYSRYGKYYMCIVCKHTNDEGFIITAYLTDAVKKGERVYEAHKNYLR